MAADSDTGLECDVLVVGSGASGMAAAIAATSHGLKVIVVEKEPRFGGTTARSGGWLWIPGTRLAMSWESMSRPRQRAPARNRCVARPRLPTLPRHMPSQP